MDLSVGGLTAVSATASQYERMLTAAGLTPIAGADEAGRGACAGPLLAAAVILSSDPARQIVGLADSKTLSATARQRLYGLILERAEAVAWAEVPAADCDALGIQQANLTGLRQAVEALQTRPGFVITDGFAVPGLATPSVGMWKADQVVACVSAASIVAKVVRDQVMDELDAIYPAYGFGAHKGYATAAHQRQLDQLGPCPEHRLSYGNVAKTIKVETS